MYSPPPLTLSRVYLISFFPPSLPLKEGGGRPINHHHQKKCSLVSLILVSPSSSLSLLKIPILLNHILKLVMTSWSTSWSPANSSGQMLMTILPISKNRYTNCMHIWKLLYMERKGRKMQRGPHLVVSSLPFSPFIPS